MSTITDALSDLRAGRVTLGDVEALFRRFQWVRERKTFDQLMAEADALAVGQQPVATFTEVEFAYTYGVISHDQYTHLARVVAELTARPESEDEAS